ncbi:MAG: metallophosphoesterase [Desulfococcaceae bacterium]|jgi:UDP-2,3-diacylglucosamine pyrophosphatase LpxH|nr:metallophosphoesterase [Desulfococcaceae bacterium]
MILITDSHTDRRSAPAFFHMLKKLETYQGDIVFLGDIFDLWIALPGYENELHRKFLHWCRKEKKKRSVGLLEGNHEFFVAEERKEYFSWCTNAAVRAESGGILFCHGDRINRKDKNYLRFRKLTKNSFIKRLLQSIPFGPIIVEKIKSAIKSRKNRFRKYMPESEIMAFAAQCFTQGKRLIFIGHFHQNGGFVYSPDTEKKLFLLPDWQSSGKISLYDENTGKISMIK